MGLYPNICVHKEKRNVMTTEGKHALIHKSSVNCNNRDITFRSPFFVFGEKVCYFQLLFMFKAFKYYISSVLQFIQNYYTPQVYCDLQDILRKMGKIHLFQ